MYWVRVPGYIEQFGGLPLDKEALRCSKDAALATGLPHGLDLVEHLGVFALGPIVVGTDREVLPLAQQGYEVTTSASLSSPLLKKHCKVSPTAITGFAILHLALVSLALQHSAFDPNPLSTH